MRERVIIFLVLFWSALVLCFDINKPFIGQHDWNSVVYSQQARNYLRYGYYQLHFAPVDNAGLVADPAEFRYSTHYPPLLPILISFSFRTFGIREWSARLVPIIFSLGTILMTVKIGELLAGRTVGWRAGLLASVTPIFIYYGKIPVHEAVIPGAALLVFYCYFKFKNTKEKKWQWGMIFSMLFSGSLGWPGYYPAIIICGYEFWFNRKNITGWLVPAVAGCLMFGLFLFYVSGLERGENRSLWDIFLLRAGWGERVNAWPFSTFDYIKMEARYGVNLFSASLLGMSLVWFVNSIFNRIKGEIKENETRLWMLAIFGGMHLLLFRNLAWLHEYMIIYLLPFIAISASWLVNIVFTRYKLPGIWFWMVLMIVFLERREYAGALLRSEYGKEVYQEAVRLNRITEADQTVCPQIEVGDGGYLFNFYADRKISCHEEK